MNKTLLAGIGLIGLLTPSLAGAASFTWASASDALSTTSSAADGLST